MRASLALAVCGCLGLALGVEGAGVAKKGPAPKAEVRLTVPQLLARLGDPHFRVRQAAHKALGELGIDALPALQQARKTTTDLEVIQRLDRLIPHLEHAAMLQPQRVTLHLKKRTLQEVIAELSKQTGYAIDLENVNNNELHSFDFDRLPFWQAIDRICKEAKVSLYPYYYGNNGERLRLYPYGAPPGPYVQYRETFRLVATGFNYGRSVSFNGSFEAQQPQPQRSEHLNFNLTIHTEIKLPFLAVHPPVVAEAYDENKKNMAPQAAVSNYYGQPQYSKYGNGMRSYFHTQSVSLVRPSRDSKVARLIKGEIPVLLLGKQKPLIVVDNPATVKKKKFKGGKTEIEIDQVTEANNWGNNGKTYQVQMTVREETNQTQNDYPWAQSLQHRLELQDAKGNKYVIWSSGLYSRGPRLAQGAVHFRPATADFGPPVRLTFYEWVPVQHRIQFEFKDLPLP